MALQLRSKESLMQNTVRAAGGMSARAETIVRRTYSRPKADGSFETWPEIVERVKGHQRWLWQRARGDVPLTAEQEQELSDLAQLMLDRKISVSGRTLWLGGTAVAKRRESSMFNCAFTKIETVHDVVDAFWLLLQGCGVGFEPIVGTLNGFTKPVEIQTVRSQRHLLEEKHGRETNAATLERDASGRMVYRLQIGDSAEAWAKAVGKLLAEKRPFDVLVLDFSQIRPAGERLKGYGWISSGDETFAPAMVSISEILAKKSGQLLSRMDILDIVNHLGTTLSSRRSAEIALVPFEDAEWLDFAKAKDKFWEKNNFHRQQSNNSLVFSGQPTRGALQNLFSIMQEVGGSEPGLVNGTTAKLRAPWFSGCNPCVTGDTPILTDEGYIAIRDTVGKKVRVWNGESFSEVTPFSTGVNPLVKVVLSDGTSLECTPYHEWILAGGVRVMANELREGDRLEKFAMPVVTAGETYAVDAYSQGFYSGDGCTDNKVSYIYEPKYPVIKRLIGKVASDGINTDRMRWLHGPMLEKTFVPVNGTKEYCLDWLAGLLDADGTVTNDINGNGLQISSIDLKFLQEVRLMLTRLGVRAKISKGRSSGLRLMPNGRGGVAPYFCQDTYRLLIGNTDTYHLLSIGLKVERLALHNTPPQRDARRFVTVEAVIDLMDFEETFCFTDPIANRGTFNGIVTGQCAEILLPNKGFCNLVELNLSAFNNNLQELWKAAYIVARANYRQTCVNLVDGILQRAWHENNEFLRLCGVGVTGVAKFAAANDRTFWRYLRNQARAGAFSMAKELNLPEPKAVTTVKPSGTLSKIMDTTEGVHTPLGRYVLNNVRFSKHDPYVDVLRKANYKVIEDPSSSDAVLVTFPVDNTGAAFSVVDGREVNLETAVEQLERYKLLMEHYVDHNCSVTISYSPDEVPAIVDWLSENWDIYVGVSFLYRNDPTKTAEDLGYLYLPQEVVTEEVYKAYVKGLKPLKKRAEGSQELKEEADDYTIDTGECSSGACPIR
jgi:ribonucleotide reductase alpha subunit